jgi:hypothetical protein
MFISTALLSAVALAASSPSTPPTQPEQGSVTQPIRLLDLLGIKLPEGDELTAMIAGAASHPLGSRENPVRTVGIAGQRSYLARLRCSDGKPPKSQRTSSAGFGPFGRIMDAYWVQCGSERREVFLDMYHDHVEAKPVPGYTIVSARR